MSKRLICLVARADAPTETFIRRDLVGLRNHGWRADLLSLDRLPPRAAAQLAPGVAVGLIKAVLRRTLVYYREPRQGVAVLRRLPWICRAVRHSLILCPDLIHAHFAWITADLGALIAAASGVPFVCSVHAWDCFAQPRRTLRQRLMPARAVIACTQAGCDAVAAAGIAPERIHRVPHGLPLGEFPFSPDPPAELGLVAVGRLEPKKGFDTLVQALAQLTPAFPDLQLAIVGEGSQRAALQAQIAALGLARRVTLHGLLPERATQALIRRSRALVLPSRRLPNGDRDGIANVLIEAMALGTPVITTTASAAAEWVQHEVCGLLIPPDAPALLAAALKTILTADPNRRLAWITAARRCVENEFDAAQTIPRLDALLAACGD